MDGQAIIAVSAAVVTLVQLVKWAGIPDKWGPLAVLLFAAVGVGVWAYSQNEAGIARQEIFDYFAGWITVATSAAGVFGFTRATASAVISAKPPPAGAAGSSSTI
jgi:hypothetical protein